MTGVLTCALPIYVDVDYFLKSKKNAQRASQTYILRKDDGGKWRILGFYQ